MNDFVVIARHGESSTTVTQTAQRKEKPPEESTRHQEGKSRRWQEGKIEEVFYLTYD